MNRRIAAIAIVVPDYDDALSFYRDAMRFDVLTDEDQGDGKRWITVAPPGGGTALLLAKAATEAQEAAIGQQTGGRVGFFLETDDFPRDHARMRAAGIPFEEPPRREPYGTVAVFADPWGNRWDLIQRT